MLEYRATQSPRSTEPSPRSQPEIPAAEAGNQGWGNFHMEPSPHSRHNHRD
jgi:hypothetical protein